MPNGPITDHFTWEEAACRCGRHAGLENPPHELHENVRTAAEMMEKVRAALGGHPVFVTSWWRCPVHNQEVGGDAQSFHLLGRAVDLVSKFTSPPEAQAVCRDLQEEGIVGGLGSYAGFTHVDTGPRRNWP
ncbi:MAG: DUF882 domain-containing protein [Armatimonadetes bacterium]|nr:DUF882 domain-containing protein [Armatimonadota bacterium]